MRKLLIAGLIFICSFNVFALECTGTITGLVSDSGLCNGNALYKNSENPNYWICSDSVKSDALLLVAFSLDEQVKTEINAAGNCSSLAQHYLVAQAIAMLSVGPTLPNGPYEVDYLIVGGGGGGGSGEYAINSHSSAGGGGGAGGWLSGTLTLTPGTNYNIVIGSGGAGATYNPGSGSTGGNSSFAGIVAQGGAPGGAGGVWGDPNGRPDYGGGLMGPSGGGGGGAALSHYSAWNAIGGRGGSALNGGTQGSWGGDGGRINLTDEYIPGGGGGGGAGSGGSLGHSGGVIPYGNEGYGGSGLSWEGQGYFAGGGGGARPGNSLASSGGIGGGGDGSTLSGNGNPGAPNTGGGGGGAYDGTGGNGGSGVVILKIPGDKYSGTTTGSVTVTESGGYKYVKFTTSGSYSG